MFLEINFSSLNASGFQDNNLENGSVGRQSALSVDVSFRGSRGASDDSLNVDRQIRYVTGCIAFFSKIISRFCFSPAKNASRKSKPPPPPPSSSANISPRSKSNARASFHALQSDRPAPLKPVEINEAEMVLPSRSATANAAPGNVSQGHRKSNSLDRPVRPPWTLGVDSKRTTATTGVEIDTAPRGSIENEPAEQLFSVSASELDTSDQLKEPDDLELKKSATLPRPQQRAQPPPVPSKTNLQQRPTDLDVEAAVAPTMVRVSPSDDSDDEEPVVEEVGAGDRRRNKFSSAGANERGPNEQIAMTKSPVAPQPMPRRHPTSPKDVSYVSVVEEMDNMEPMSATRSSFTEASGLQQTEGASASAPLRPKPPVPSKPRALESPEKDSIIRL